MRRLPLVAVGLGALSLAATSVVTLADPHAGSNPWPYGANDRAPVLAAVGDISCQPGGPVEGEKQSDVCDKTGAGYTTRWQAQTATANQIEALQPTLVAILGDEQYEVGRYQDFMGSFDHTYGAFKFLQRPAPGNHEFYTEHGESGVGGAGYFDYYNGYQVDPTTGNPLTATFQVPAGQPVAQPIPRQNGQAGAFGDSGDGWYSYDLGGWHIISLNAECDIPAHGSCDPNAAWFQSETQWLAQDLQNDHAACTMAYWHQPTFSAADPSSSAPGADPEGPAADAWWQLLASHHADLILNGHDHLYARFAPMDPNGKADPRNGIREFIIGTGGESLDTLNTSAPNLQTGTGDFYGVMKLTLDRGSYSWDYASALKSPSAPASDTAASFSDTGRGRCHGGGN